MGNRGARMKKKISMIIKEDKAYYFGTGIKHIYRFITHNPLELAESWDIINQPVVYFPKYVFCICREKRMFLGKNYILN